MSDIIRLLPESIANQIAAGEVVQRPASVVKELVENSVDAGAKHIQIFLKEAGKMLVKVIDDGKGMSVSDARMAFERHATSKIQASKDLFAIQTLGFRGEALASIAAVAQVEMKTRLMVNELGTLLQVEGSTVINQEVCTCPVGTQIAVKNLFFNIPARRKFLKSDTVELRHILDEFQRIAIAYPKITFHLYHNEKELYKLPSGKWVKRIIDLFGKNLQSKLIPIEEQTDYIHIKGYLGGPELSRKRKAQQFLLVNGRYIRSHYLQHGIKMAYEHIIPTENSPFYVLELQIDPDKIDVNVHPTKQEIKFDDEKVIYSVLKAGVRHAISKHYVFPTLDFEQDPIFAQTVGANSVKPNPAISRPPSNPNVQKDWQALYDGLEKRQDFVVEAEPSLQEELSPSTDRKLFQLHNTFIVSSIKSGFLLIHQQYAHERILYERYLQQIKDKKASTQKLLFSRQIHLDKHSAELIKSLLPQIQDMGFDIAHFGGDSFVLDGIPAHLSSESNEEKLIIDMLQHYEDSQHLKVVGNERLAYSMAMATSKKVPAVMHLPEMETLIDELFACEIPFENPVGKKCFITFDTQDLLKKFNA